MYDIVEEEGSVKTLSIRRQVGVLATHIHKINVYPLMRTQIKIMTSRPSKYVNIGVNPVKPIFSGHSKIDKTKVLKTNGS